MSSQDAEPDMSSNVILSGPYTQSSPKSANSASDEEFNGPHSEGDTSNAATESLNIDDSKLPDPAEQEML